MKPSSPSLKTTKYRIVKMNSGRYALQSRGWLWGWNYFRYIMGEDIAVWDTLEAVQRRLDRQLRDDEEAADRIAEVVKEI